MQTLIAFKSEVNTIHSDFVRKLGLKIWSTNVRIQKIDGFKLDIFGIVITSFLVEDKNKGSLFFEETFLLTNLSIDVALGILFLTLSNIKINLHD